GRLRPPPESGHPIARLFAGRASLPNRAGRDAIGVTEDAGDRIELATAGDRDPGGQRDAHDEQRDEGDDDPVHWGEHRTLPGPRGYPDPRATRPDAPRGAVLRSVRR